MWGWSHHFVGISSTFQGVNHQNVSSLKDTKWRRWVSNPRPLTPESETLPLGHHAPLRLFCVKLLSTKVYIFFDRTLRTIGTIDIDCCGHSKHLPLSVLNSTYSYIGLIPGAVVRLSAITRCARTRDQPPCPAHSIVKIRS